MLNPGGDDARSSLAARLCSATFIGALVEEGRLGRDDVQLRVAAVAAPKMRSESRLAMVSDSRDLSSAIDLALAVASAAANWRLASRRSRFCAAASSLRSYCAWSSACRWGQHARGGIRGGVSGRGRPFGGGQKTRVDLRCEVNARGSMARAWERWWGATVWAGRGGAGRAPCGRRSSRRRDRRGR